MARSSKKGPFVDLSLEKKIAKAKETMIESQSKLGQEAQ
jgi:ribosomal protein S19